MAIDRSKFKSSSVSQLTSADKELKKTLGKKDTSSSNGHDLDEGANLLRIYPVHPESLEKDEKASFCVPFIQTFLPAMVPEKSKDGVVLKDTKGNDKTKLSVKPVFNAIVHGGKPKDLVQEYIKLAGDWAFKNIKDSDARKAFMEPVYGNFQKKINGITYPDKWVVYADKYPNANPDSTPVFDKFFFKKSIKDKMNIISQMETKNDPLGTDPFTDIEEGRAISIFVNKEGGAQNYYTTELDTTTTTEIIRGKPMKVQKQWPLSDDQLEHFLSQKSLMDLFGNCAKRKNFETQLAGLQLFDDKNNMGIFALPEWESIVIEIDGYYPEEGSESANEELPEEIVDDAINDQDEFDLMNRAELQAFAKEFKTGILAKPGMSDEDLRDKLRKWQLAASELTQEPLPGEEGYVEPEVISLVEKAEVIPDTPEQKEAFINELKGEVKEAPVLTAKEKLAAMRAKTMNKE